MLNLGHLQIQYLLGIHRLPKSTREMVTMQVKGEFDSQMLSTTRVRRLCLLKKRCGASASREGLARQDLDQGLVLGSENLRRNTKI